MWLYCWIWTKYLPPRWWCTVLFIFLLRKSTIGSFANFSIEIILTNGHTAIKSSSWYTSVFYTKKILYTESLFPKVCLFMANQILEINYFMWNFIAIMHKWKGLLLAKLMFVFGTHICYLHWVFSDIYIIVKRRDSHLLRGFSIYSRKSICSQEAGLSKTRNPENLYFTSTVKCLLK